MSPMLEASPSIRDGLAPADTAEAARDRVAEEAGARGGRGADPPSVDCTGATQRAGQGEGQEAEGKLNRGASKLLQVPQ